MKKNQILTVILSGALICFGTFSCTNLNEVPQDGFISAAEGGAVNTASFLQTAYNGLREFQNQGQMFALGEMSTDALVGPTRGGDWDDNGAWRQIHNHTWGKDHVQVRDAWNTLLSNVYNCNQVIFNNGTTSEIAEARFLRAFYYYHIVDLYGQAPYRIAGEPLKNDPKIWSRSEATNFIISELEAIVGSLPARIGADASKVNKDAAYFMLAKIYLNKAIFTGVDAAGPYTFAAADMTKVVANVDMMTNSLEADYWKNFEPNNNTSTEIVFSCKNVGGAREAEIRSRWYMGSHYSQLPGGWNGFATVAEYYNNYNPNDNRIKNASAYMISNFGNNAGYQVGQMKNGKNRDEKGRDKDPVTNIAYTNLAAGTLNLQDRNGAPLIFTPALTLITGGSTLESAGIRGMKYIPDATNLDKPENDYVLMRYADAMLMKAEAILRGGTGTAPNFTGYFARTGQPAVTLDLTTIYTERGRELWWEGWRRNDMVRFGKFLNQRGLKPYVSNPKYILYPIPADALLNPNIKQNPGY